MPRALIFLGVAMVFLALTASGQNITLVSETKPSAQTLQYGDVWAEDDLACLGIYTPYSTGGYGVGIFSITNPANPVLLANYYPSPTANNQFEQGLIRDRIGYFASWSGSGGLHILSLTNPTSPLLLSRITGNVAGTVTNGHNRVHTMFLDRNFVYLADHLTPTVKVFDISNPAAPAFVRNITTTNTVKVHQITVATNGSQIRLYTSGWGDANTGNPPGKTDIWDVTSMSASQAPTWLGAVITGHRAHSSWPTPDGNHLVICREISGGEVSIWNISNPATPILASSLTTAGVGIEPAIPHNPVMIGNTLYVAWYQAGLQMFNIANPARPVRIGSFDTRAAGISGSFEGNWGVYPFQGPTKVMLADMQRGFLIVDASAAFTATNNYPPLIIRQPSSLTKNAGEDASFAVDATGPSLSYQWRLNGIDIAGATASTLTRSMLTGADAGSYTVVVSNNAGALTSQPATLSVSLPSEPEYWQLAFSDDFESDTSTNWFIFPGSSNGINDYTAEFAHDYSIYFSVYNGTNIPPAPNSAPGTTRGLKVTVNKNDAIAATAGVSFYPQGQHFNGAYRLKFDLWMNYPGGVWGAGAIGSTETASFGLNHTATRVNWDNGTSTPSDGVWFGVTGEGGYTSPSADYRVYAGSPTNRATQLLFPNDGLPASGATSADHSNAYFQSIFPSPSYETSGAPGKRWVQVEVAQSANNVVTWRINGNLISQRTNSSSFTNGNIMVGYMDLSSSRANPAADAFLVYDNIRVEILSTSAPPAIVSQPQSVVAVPGDFVAFSVGVVGTAPFEYQWRFNGLPIPGATSSSYTRPNVQTEDQGNYSVVISNAASVTTSSNALLSLAEFGAIRNVRATPGPRSAIISWQTSVPASSQVNYDMSQPIPLKGTNISRHSELGSVSYLSAAPTTNHLILLTGLEPDSSYFYEAVSFDGTNSHVSAEYNFKTAGSIIVDNPDAVFTGAWTHNATSATNKYSVDYSFALTTNAAPTASATFIPTITTPGKYDVYVWYSHGNNRATDAPFLVAFEGGSEVVRVNQRTNGGMWQLISSAKPFRAGTSGFVRLLNDSASGTVVIADAVRWVYVEEPGDPAPAWWSNFFFSTNANPSLDHDGDGFTTAEEYVWGTNPKDNFSFGRFELGAGQNALQFRVYPLLNNRAYRLQTRSNLLEGEWLTLSEPHPHGNEFAEGFMTLTNSGTQNFYRLRVDYTTNSAEAH